ncbi:MAG: bifunctional (p)ppGpp synthetase/guanosine-3',5'-bis(diphosphate) 3'-pyrophosphohydrolase [Clostridia bacterium]|nr:bifunctional (p)ppGpp synthetase/guanosine-3',5'-bis(diphosphate) 3'-pyrophosphohydrolase [Clostridia bacterium]
MDDFVKLIKEKYENPKVILDAYDFACSAHKGVKRLSGDDYIIHPIEVAKTLVNLGMDDETIAAALLHDVVEDTPVTFKTIKKLFGENIEKLVKGVTKISSLKYETYEDLEMESLKRLFVAMSKDIRVILIKLADRLHNMRTIEYLPYDRRIKCCNETMNLFVPIAEKLGLNSIKLELEDICFKNLKPAEYNKLKEELDRKYEKSKARMGDIEKELKQALVDLNIKGEVSSRFKHFYSVYKKLKDRGTAKIYDIIAFRIIVDDVKDCYVVLGKIHQMYKPVAGRIKDYIAAPKLNGYQSLHTTLIMKDGTPFEVQIRTYAMHRFCEYGIASHWRYKSKVSSKDITDDKFDMFRSIIQEKKQYKDSSEFIKALTMDFSLSEIWVFTPKYKPISLPENSTPVDMAYAVHTELGNTCIGAKVNGKKVPLNYRLETGDVVEIITSDEAVGPSRDWLKFAVSNSARAHIRNYFRKHQNKESVAKGREALEKCAKKNNLPFDWILSNEFLDEVKKAHLVYSMDDLFSLISSGTIRPEEMISIAKETFKKKDKKSKQENSSTLIDGVDVPDVKLAHCCTPVPGDKIVAISSNSGLITVHSASCKNLKLIDQKRLLQAVWKDNIEHNKTFDIYFKITGVDKYKLLENVLNVFYSNSTDIINVSATTNGGKFVITVLIKVKDLQEFENLKENLLKIESVQNVVRNSIA